MKAAGSSQGTYFKLHNTCKAHGSSYVICEKLCDIAMTLDVLYVHRARCSLCRVLKHARELSKVFAPHTPFMWRIRLVEDLFQGKPPGSNVSLQYLELRDNKLRDLLNPTNTAVKPTMQGVTYATTVAVEDVQQFGAVYNKGAKERSQRPHSKNLESSRSHAICTLVIQLGRVRPRSC